MTKLLNIIVIIIFFILGLFSLSLSHEQLTITTYYPSPYGSYRELRTNRMAVGPTRAMPTRDGALVWGAERGLLTPDQGASIELGGIGTPYIDFSNDATSDYDVRIILTDDNTLTIEGGILIGAVSCRRYTFTRSSGTQNCPAGYAITQAPVTPSTTSGTFLCCRYE